MREDINGKRRKGVGKYHKIKRKIINEFFFKGLKKSCKTMCLKMFVRSRICKRKKHKNKGEKK